MPQETSESTQDSGSVDVMMDNNILESQGLTEVAEQDLMGTDDGKTDNSDSEKSDSDDSTKDSDTGDKKPDEDETSDDKSDDGDKSEEDEKDSKETDDSATEKAKSAKESKSASSSSKVGGKPPKGFVPTAALHEARGENNYLKDQIRDMQDKFDTLLAKGSNQSNGKDAEKLDNFKEISEAEYEALVEDEPGKALLYMQKLNKFQQLQFEVAQQQQADNQANAYESQIMTTVTETMEKMVPGLFDEDTKVHDELVEFASSVGFTDDMFYLTNPQTQIILPGETEPLFLADQAASILQVLVDSRTKIGTKAPEPDEKAATEVQTKLEAKIRKEVETELLAKFKTDKEGTFKSLQQLSKTRDVESFGDKVFTEAQFAKLSAKEQELYLSGTD